MLELKRDHDVNNHSRFTIKTNEGNFKIFYGSDSCLYWSCTIPNENIEGMYQYTITDDNIMSAQLIFEYKGENDD